MSSMHRHDGRVKPGAVFAFKPSDTIASSDPPDFAQRRQPADCVLQNASTMVNERAPSEAPSQPFENPGDGGKPQRDESPDDDVDITAVVQGWSAVNSGSSGLASTSHPARFGHPTKMASSLKQKTSVFIHQKSRPEHHLGTKISGPSQPTYQDRRPPPLPVFNSNALVDAPWSYCGDDVFYTDPTKTSVDLKALLEGGMDDDEADGDEQQPGDAGQKKDESAETQAQSTQQKKDWLVDKDGVVDGLKVQLLPHQVEGVNWMRGRELGPVKRGKVPKGGLLADDMGLGKTLQTVSLMLTNRKPAPDDKRWKKHYEGIDKTTLVVAPLALIRQWEHEIRDKVAKSHGLKVLVHHGPQRTKRSKDLALYDVVITTYQILVSEHGKSSAAADGLKAGCFGLHWWRVVLDEAHSIKNHKAKSTKACYALRSEYRWCLSGTPMQNNLDELQSLVRFLRIKPYDDLKQWKEHIDMPMKDGKGHIAIRRLHSLLRCFMKRRTKEILKEEGALNPGGKPSADGEALATGFRHTERNVVAVSATLDAAERWFYSRLEKRADKSLEAMMQDKISYANAFTLLLCLRQVCNHPKLVEGKLNRDVMSTGSSRSAQDMNMNAVADMFAGMDIATTNCSICGKILKDVDTDLGRGNCSECDEDLAYFKKEHQASERKRTKKKSKSNRVAMPRSAEKKKGEAEAEPAAQEQNKQAQRRPRNRNAVIDSDDEEEADGSWLVPEGERGDVRLGKAGGDDDENAEGGGDWIGSEDSADETDDEQDQSNLSSFVVDNETAKKEAGYRSAGEASEDDDSSLLSVSALTSKMAAQTLEDSRPAAPRGRGSDAGSGPGSSGSGADSDSEAEASDGGEQVVASAKIRELTRLLRAEARQHKFIVFSQFTSMLDLVEPFLRRDGFAFARYDGSMRSDAREESLRRLREDPRVRILLCSLLCGSLGLNLTAATRVIIVEPFWNPFVEEQAIDRVHRLNQTADVTVYKLTVADTVETRIFDLQARKRLLAEQTIEGGARKEEVKLGLAEIIDLFKPGAHAEAEAPPPAGPAAAEQQQTARRPAGDLLRRKPAREESAVYGRRW